MSDPDTLNADNPPDSPGSTRTWWHPLFARMLNHLLATAYSVEEEVPIGQLPLRVDILLTRRETGELSEASRRELGALVPLLNRYTLIQFKGPTDTLRQGDLSLLIGYAYVWCSQQVERIPQKDVSLIVVAPTLNRPMRNELEDRVGKPVEQEKGIIHLSGLPFTSYLVETDAMAERGEPVLSLVSRMFLRHRERIIEQLTRTGHETLLLYMLQQVAQFRKLGEDFAMQHKDSVYMGEVEEDLLNSVLASIPAEKLRRRFTPEQEDEILAAIPVEKRLHGLPPEERLRGLPPEERLRGLPPEEVLRSLTPEQFAASLSEEQAARLRELLERRQSG